MNGLNSSFGGSNNEINCVYLFVAFTLVLHYLLLVVIFVTCSIFCTVTVTFHI